MAPSASSPLEPNLVLIGYRATGKSAVATRLAALLARPLVNLDKVLMEEAGKDIATLVAEQGWEEFRRREKELVRRASQSDGQVLDSGGGVVLDPDNIKVLKENGILIWLTAEPAVIKERLRQDLGTAAGRPGLTSRDPLAEVEQVLAQREPLYRLAADIIIDTTHRSIPEVVDRILVALREGPGERGSPALPSSSPPNPL